MIFFWQRKWIKKNTRFAVHWSTDLCPVFVEKLPLLAPHPLVRAESTWREERIINTSGTQEICSLKPLLNLVLSLFYSIGLFKALHVPKKGTLSYPMKDNLKKYTMDLRDGLWSFQVFVDLFRELPYRQSLRSLSQRCMTKFFSKEIKYMPCFVIHCSRCDYLNLEILILFKWRVVPVRLTSVN